MNNEHLPDIITDEYIHYIVDKLRSSTKDRINLSSELIKEILTLTTELLKLENNLLKIYPKEKNDDNYFIIVGDLHGQFSSLIQIFETYGYPNENQKFILLGDYVDRGIYGIEIYL